MFDREFELRIQIGAIGPAPGALAYWAIYATDSRGQWALVVDGQPDPFEGNEGQTETLRNVLINWLNAL